MKNMFKMTLFKKIFLTILSGLLCVEVIHIYLDYQASVKRITDNKNLSMAIRTEREDTAFIRDEDVEKIKDNLYNRTKKYDGYFMMFDKEGHILHESANKVKDDSYQIISFYPDAPFNEWFLDTRKKINYTSHYLDLKMFDHTTIKKIKDYILEHKDEKIMAYIDLEMSEDFSKIVKINSLCLDDTVILGSGVKNEYPYIVYKYYDDELYYYNNDYDLQKTDTGEHKIEWWTSDNFINECRDIYQKEFYKNIEWALNIDNDFIRRGSIDSLRIGDDLYLMYYDLYRIDELDVQGFVNIVKYGDIYDNVLERTIDEKLIAYITAIFIAIISSWFISYILTRRIRNINRVTKLISKRNFDNHLPEDSDDELGTLSKSINEMSADLKNTIDELKIENEKIKELELLRKDFINQFTHEMKTPLGVINGYSELIEITEDDNEKQRYLTLINQETSRINELVLSMLKLSRLEAGKVELHKEDIDLEYLVVGVVDEFEVLLKKKNIKVIINCIDNHINGDKEQVKTVIRNFISNAIKHTDTKIVVTIDKGVKVFNEGKPIDEDKLNGIWYTFVTHDKTGTGLGLAICRSILELHNYQYGVTNKENGVEFYFFE